MSKIILVVISYFIYFTQAKIVDDFRYVLITYLCSFSIHRAHEIEIKVQYQMYT